MGTQVATRPVCLLGGPLDGYVSKRSSVPPQFTWVDMVTLRFCKTPGPNRHLYRLLSVSKGKAGKIVLEYAGHDSFCSKCGSFHEQLPEKLSNCTLCGGELRPASA